MGLLTSDNPKDKTKLQANNNLINNSTEYRKMVIGILLNDILKLKVDYSFCNRGGGWGGFTKTTDEGVCMDPENRGTDAVGNIRRRFKEKLHRYIEHLVKVLNAPTCPYPLEIKTRINTAVIVPYIDMIKQAKPEWGPANTFYLTNNGKLSDDAITSAKTEAVSKLTLDNLTPSGGGLFGKSLDIKPSPERDILILKDLEGRAYDFVTHDALVKFLIGVEKFVKAENEPSSKEKEEAKKVADEVVKMEQSAAAAAAAAAAALVQGTGTGTEPETGATATVAGQQGQNSGIDNGTRDGGRRLTRKRSFKPKKNRRKTRGLKAAPFKSAAAALKAYHRK